MRTEGGGGLQVSGRRPWKGYQQSYAKRMDRYLGRLQKRGFVSEKEVKASAEYEQQTFRTAVVLKNLGSSLPIEKVAAMANAMQDSTTSSTSCSPAGP